MSSIIAIIFQAIFIILIAPFAMGLVRFFKARLQGRRGASPLLPYFTFATLAKKEMVISSAASWVFRAVPFVVFSASILLILVLPLLFHGGKLAGLSDFLVVAGILMIEAIFLVLGGLDPGSAFGGMGSSREMTIAALAEPTVIMIFAAMSFVTGTSAIDGMMGGQLLLSHPYLLFSIIALIMIALAENKRYPVDNPATHLELTMVHEAMVLEYSGFYLMLLEFASAIKLAVFAILISNFIFPTTVFGISEFGAGSILMSVVFGTLKVIITMGLLALLESMIVKMRFYRMQEYLSIAFFAALFGMVFAVFATFANIAIEYHAFFAVFAVFFAVLLFGRARLNSMLRNYAFSSLAIAGIAFALSNVAEAEKTHLWIFAGATIIIKSFFVPRVIRFSQRKCAETNLPSFLRPTSSYFAAIVILAFTFFIMKHAPLVGMVEFNSLLFASVALILLGLATMVVQHSVFSQIMGLLTIENGIAIFVLATVKSLPLFIELGVFIITIASALILSSLSARIKEFCGTSDTEDLRSLIE